MINTEKYNNVLDAGLLLDHFALLCCIRDNQAILKHKRIVGFQNLLCKKGFILNNNLTEKALNLVGEEQLTGTVTGLTYLPSDDEFGYSFGMLSGYSESVLLGNEAVCIVPNTMLEKMTGQKEVIFLRQSECSEFVEYKIVGTHEGKPDDIFCSFSSFNENLSRDEYNIYSFGFLLSNAKYNENVAEILKKYFIEPSISGAVTRKVNELNLPFRYAYVMPKGNLDDVIRPI